MRLELLYREQIANLRNHLVDELDQIVSVVGGWSATEHDDDGRHTDITADSVTTALLTATIGSITTLSVTTLTVSSVILSGFTQGSVLFAGPAGLVSQDNANFFWDDTNNALGVGVPSPGASVIKAGSVGEASITIASDINAISADTDAFLRFTIDGVVGTLKGLVGYDQGLDRFVLGYSAVQLMQISSAGNMSIPQSLQVGAASLPGAGSFFVVFPDGTAPSSLASNTAALYGDDFGGTVALRGINEAGDINQITQGFIPTQRDLAPGSFTVPTGRYIVTTSLTLSGSESATLNGTAKWVMV